MPDYKNYNARKTGEYGKIWTTTGKCVLCDLREKYVLIEDGPMVLTMNIFPYIEGHLMIVPIRHIEMFEELTDEEFSAMRRLAVKGKAIINAYLKTDDKVWFLFRMPEGHKAAKTVAHVHAHVIPYSDDLFKWDYQEINEPVEETAKKLRKLL